MKGAQPRAGEIAPDIASFAAAVEIALQELRADSLSAGVLNLYAARLDQLGRRIHALDMTRGHEVGRFLTMAVAELIAARDQIGAECSASVQRAAEHLRAASAHLAEGS